MISKDDVMGIMLGGNAERARYAGSLQDHDTMERLWELNAAKCSRLCGITYPGGNEPLRQTIYCLGALRLEPPLPEYIQEHLHTLLAELAL